MARCALLLAALLLLAAPLAHAARPLPTGNDEPRLVPVGFIVSLNDGVATDTAAQALASTHGLHLRSTFGAVNAFHFDFPSSASEQAQTLALQRLKDDPRVAIVEADGVVQATDADTINAGISFMWANVNGGAGPTKNATSTSPASVRLAIIDTGVQLNHPDLRVSPSIGYYASGFTTFDDANGHGTHCAGIATALFNNGGIVGVAPNAEVVSVRVLDSTGSGTIASVISGINWVASYASTYKIKVASISISGGGVYTTLDSAITALDKAQVAVVVAAGNDGDYLMNFSPGRASGAITITSIADSYDANNPTWSNYGGPTLSNFYAAPGVGINSTWISSGYSVQSGTSMSTPFVSGLLIDCFLRGKCTSSKYSTSAKSYLQNCVAAGAVVRYHPVTGQTLGPEIRYKTC